MRTAIVHYWLLNMRGGEKVVEALCRIFPDADLFTLVYDPDRVSDLIRSRRITASFLNPFRKFYRSLLPLAPFALESFDLSGYDLVISSESGPAKGVITRADTRHFCYCHTPMRYLWDLYPQYLHEWTRNPLRRAALAVCGNYLRMWDAAAAARVDEFIANSRNVQRRIWKAYRRQAEVIYPPVAVETFHWKPPKDYFLIASELVAYKRLDLAVAACTRLGRRLRIVGEGPEYKRLRRAAGPSIEFCGRVSDEELRGLYAECRALIVPGEEDFGLAAVEALASGKPLIALERGGAVEAASVVEPSPAVFFPEPTVHALEGAIIRFDRCESSFSPQQLAAGVARFSESEFAARIRNFISRHA